MRSIILGLIFFLIVLNPSPADFDREFPGPPMLGENEVADWENPDVVGRNKEPGHVTYIPYADVPAA